jgi:hypothetical protein
MTGSEEWVFSCLCVNAPFRTDFLAVMERLGMRGRDCPQGRDVPTDRKRSANLGG